MRSLCCPGLMVGQVPATSQPLIPCAAAGRAWGPGWAVPWGPSLCLSPVICGVDDPQQHCPCPALLVQHPLRSPADTQGPASASCPPAGPAVPGVLGASSQGGSALLKLQPQQQEVGPCHGLGSWAVALPSKLGKGCFPCVQELQGHARDCVGRAGGCRGLLCHAKRGARGLL